VIVVDATVITAFILREPGWKKYADIIKNCCTVDHAAKEVSNAIWKSFRRGFISEEDAKAKFQAMRKLIDVNVILYNELEVLDKAFEVSIKEGITVYDALYIALSMKLGGKLATLDKRQKSVAENLGIETLVG